MKILLLDIETFPNRVYAWGLFNQFINIEQIAEPGSTACWAAKWYGEDEVMFDSIQRNTEKQMVSNMHALLEEADAVVHYNGTKFDMPTLNKEFVQYNLPPPSPYKNIDLLSTVRKQFRMASNKLDFVSKFLKIGEKTKHKGFDLWKDCMDGKKEAWAVMEEYNIQDVLLLEKLYDKLKPWIKGHANHSVHENAEVCPNCGGHHFHKRGFHHTAAGRYQRYQCQSCKTWFRDNKNVIAGGTKFTHAR